MLVYSVAFLLTLIFTFMATYYYNKIRKVKCTATANGETKISGLRNFSAQEVFDNKIKYYVFLTLAIIPLFFVAAVRYDVGTDYFYTYVPNFIKILNGQSPYTEWGFNQLNKFIQLFTDNPQWIFVVTGFIFAFCVIGTVVRQSANSVLSVLVIFFACIYFFSLNNVRQAVSASIVFAAFPFLVGRKHVRYLLCVAAACLFHLSSVIMLVPFIFINIKFIRKHFLVFAVIITCALPLMCEVLRLILINTKYNYFFDSEFNNGNSNTVNIIYNLFFFVLSYIILRKRIINDRRAYVLLVMQYFAFLVSAASIFISISEMIARTTYYFQIFNVLLVPYCYAVRNDRFEGLAFAGAYLFAYLLYFVYFILMKGYYQVLPYKWIF